MKTYLWADGKRFHLSLTAPNDKWIVPEIIEFRGKITDTVWVVEQKNKASFNEKGRPIYERTYKWVSHKEPTFKNEFDTEFKWTQYTLEP
jgi:hypothetical protein